MLRNFRGCAVAVALLLTACSQSAGPSAIVASTAGPTPVDVIQAADVSFGSNWYALETYQGRTFRWVNNDAQLHVRPGTSEKTVYIDLEPGPGIATLPMELSVNGGKGTPTASFRIMGRTTVAVTPRGNALTLHVHNGGHVVGADPRVLDFRVFAISSVAPATGALADPDVVAADIRLGSNWGILEHYEGQTFRWIDNDATFFAPAARSRRLAMTLAPGPGVGSHSFQLDVFAKGKLLKAIQVPPKTGTLTVSLPDQVNEVRLHADGGGQHVSGDPRILNFRIFGLWVTHA